MLLFVVVLLFKFAAKNYSKDHPILSSEIMFYVGKKMELDPEISSPKDRKKKEKV